MVFQGGISMVLLNLTKEEARFLFDLLSSEQMVGCDEYELVDTIINKLARSRKW